MDAQVLKAAFDGALLWGCGLGLAGVALAVLALGLARFPARVRVAVRRYGLSSVLVFGGFAAVATVTGAVTRAGKERMPAALNAEDSEVRRHGEEEAWVSTNQHESAQISIGDDSCQFVAKNSAGVKPEGETTSHGATEALRESREPSAGQLGVGISPGDLRDSVAPCEISPSAAGCGYSLSRIGTNEVFSFAPPEGAVIAENWRRHGAATDWMRLSFGGWEFPFGDAAFSSLVVFANGTILLSTNAALRPVTAPLGLVPAANWGLLAESNRPSLFWHGMRDDGSLLLTWQNALLHRAPTNPVSLQAELFPSGNVTFRYDLSRLASDGLLTNVMGGVEAGEGKRKKEEGRSAEGQISFSLSRETTSLTFVSDSERRCDAARDDFDESLGGLDPLSFPSGSTNTVWEHLVYTGTTNGPFAYPQSTERTAVLRVAVAGVGRGELLVGGRAVPLVGERSATLNTCTEETQSVSEGTFAEGEPEGRASGREGMEGRRHGVVATDSHGFARIEGDVPTALNALPLSTNLHESTRISIRDNPCQFVDKIVSGGSGASHGGTYPPSEASCTAGAMRGEARRVKPEGQLELSDRGTPVEGPGDLHSLRASVSPCETSTPNIPSLLLPVPRGQTVPLYLRASGSLAVSFSSADFAFGRLPDLAARRLTGRVNFPNASATVPCFHDYRARQREVTLPVGADAESLTCTWTAPGSVTVENIPPRSALLTGNFDGRTTTPITYTLAHPDYLFGQTTFSQTARFCPPPPEEEEEDPSAGRHYGSRGGDEDDEDDPCWHCLWELCSRDCDCCADCPHRGGSSGAESSGGASEEEEEPQPGDYEAACTNWPRLSGVLKIREPLLYTNPIRLEVPDAGAPRCCPCPDHATNGVGVAYLSDRLKAVDADGLDFRSAAETVDVRLAGARPSRAVGDAFVSFATNGAVCLDGAYTVLGVGVRRPGVDLAALDALDADFGLPIPVATNAAEASALELVTAVGLPGGNVRIGFEGASAPFALWAWDPSTATCRRLASSDGGPLDVSLAAWRRLVGGATDAATSRTAVSVTASAPGAATLVFRYWGVFDGQFVEDVARQRLTALAPPLRMDVNRDGKIDEADVAAWLAGRPFCYWFNGDTFKGDFIGASADGSRNADDLSVNGTFDLVNFFPVALDFSAFRAAWGPHATYVVRPVSADSFNFCLADVPWSEAGTVQTAPRVTLDGDAFATAPLAALPPEGRAFTYADFSRLSPESGVMLCEATRAGVSLVAEVRIGDMTVYSHVHPMDIRSVRDMYRFYSLRGAEGVANGAFGLPANPWVKPLPGERDLDVFFTHGFNVDEAGARAWGDVLFKRLWLAGSRARFSMVTWNGNHHWTGDWANGLHYHQDVCHALKTGDALRRLVEREQPDPSRRVLMAHSLGNMVACEALRQGLRVGKCFMFNAAVASESVDGSLQNADAATGSKYVPSDWHGYDPRSWAANWHRWFKGDSEDARGKMGWPGYFTSALGNAGEACNYYSTGDAVFHEADTVPGVTTGLFHWPTLSLTWPFVDFRITAEDGSWQKQETHKGVDPVAGTLRGGWGFECWQENLGGELVKKYHTASQANAMAADGSITNSPVFSHGETPLNSRNASQDDIWLALAKYVPAVSSPVGGTEALGSDSNFDLNNPTDVARPNGWGRNHNVYKDAWLHSDMKDMAYFYVYPLYEELSTKGSLK